MRARQKGVAIVLAMGVVALAAIVATAMMNRQNSWIRQSELNADYVQAQALARGSLDWTRALLSSDRRDNQVDHLDESWALQVPPIPVESGSVSGKIEDQQGRFNLNNLVKDGKVNLVQLAHFQRLLNILGLPPSLADTLVDWIDADSQPQPQNGAEDAYYQALPSPYLAANRPLTDIAELKLVGGFNEGVRARLRPFVSALPVFTAVNVNTAPPEVIAAVLDGLGLDGARALVEKRERDYFRDRTELLKQLPKDLKVASEDVTFSTSYFMVHLRVASGRAQARSVALLNRANENWPIVVWRKML